MKAEIVLGEHVVQEVVESVESLDSSPVDSSTNLRQKNVSSHLLEQYAVEGGDFLCRIMTGDERLVSSL
jgi:hypothetical protein